MTTAQELLQELSLEAEVTRRYLECIPFERSEFQPAEKSEKLGRLAIHLAEIIAWWKNVAEQDKLDFSNFEPAEIKTTQELLEYFDHLLTQSTGSLQILTDEELNKDWSMTHGVEIYFTLPKKQVLRLFCMNHLVHHRAQLGVYLRLLNIPVPATYGPSADDFDVILTRRFSKIIKLP